MAAALAMLALSGCTDKGASQFSAQAAEGKAQSASNLPQVLVHKSPTCGCCKLWVDHLRKEGFAVDVKDVDNMSSIKERVGIPYGMGSCHTAEVDGYFVEGHVPAEQIKRLLSERPKAKGLTVPAMPLGSPGMEVSSGEVQPYDVLLVAEDGSTSVFARVCASTFFTMTAQYRP